MSEPSNIAKEYLSQMTGYLSTMLGSQQDQVSAAAQILMEQIRKDGLIHVYGVGGHSYVGSEEFFYRAGGLANISPMFESSLSLAAGGQKSTMLEREENIGDKIVKAHHLGPDNVLIITSAYGINACSIDAALEAKRRECKVIGITSVGFGEKTPRDFTARHSCGKNLGEIADVVIDNHIPHGEVTVDLEGYPQKIGGTCNVLACFAINWLVMETIKLCLENGIEPPVWMCANVEGGDTFNKKYLEKYTPIIKAL